MYIYIWLFDFLADFLRNQNFYFVGYLGWDCFFDCVFAFMLLHEGLATNLDESNSQSTAVQFQLAEAEKSKQKLKNHLRQLKTDKNYYREQEKSKR